MRPLLGTRENPSTLKAQERGFPVYCEKCGEKIDDEAIVCPHCGVPTSNYRKHNTPQRSTGREPDPSVNELARGMRLIVVIILVCVIIAALYALVGQSILGLP